MPLYTARSVLLVAALAVAASGLAHASGNNHMPALSRFPTFWGLFGPTAPVVSPTQDPTPAITKHADDKPLDNLVQSYHVPPNIASSPRRSSRSSSSSGQDAQAVAASELAKKKPDDQMQEFNRRLREAEKNGAAARKAYLKQVQESQRLRREQLEARAKINNGWVLVDKTVEPVKQADALPQSKVGRGSSLESL